MKTLFYVLGDDVLQQQENISSALAKPLKILLRPADGQTVNDFRRKSTLVGDFSWVVKPLEPDFVRRQVSRINFSFSQLGNRASVTLGRAFL